MILGGGGRGKEGKGIGMSTMKNGAILQKCVNTFVPHCSQDDVLQDHDVSVANNFSVLAWGELKPYYKIDKVCSLYLSQKDSL